MTFFLLRYSDAVHFSSLISSNLVSSIPNSRGSSIVFTKVLPLYCLFRYVQHKVDYSFTESTFTVATCVYMILQNLKFPCNDSVHIRIRFIMLRCVLHQIDCSIIISIDYGATLRTYISPIRQFQIFLYTSTTRTCLR